MTDIEIVDLKDECIHPQRRSGKYPKATIYKLYQRLAMAYQSLGSFELACQAFDQAAQALNEESVQLSTKQKAKINQECIHLKNSNRKRVIAMSFTNLVDDKASLGKPGTDDLIPNNHPNIEGFSGNNSFSTVL